MKDQMDNNDKMDEGSKMSGPAVEKHSNSRKKRQDVSYNNNTLWNSQQRVGVVGRKQASLKQVESNDNSKGVILEDNPVNRLFIKNSLERKAQNNVEAYYDKGGYQPGQEPEMLKICRQTSCDYYIIDYDIGSQDETYKNGADVARAVAEVERKRGNNPVFIANSTDGQSNDAIRQEIQAVMPNANVYTSENKNDCVARINECEQAKQQAQKSQEQQPEQEASHSQRSSVNPQSGVFSKQRSPQQEEQPSKDLNNDGGRGPSIGPGQSQ